MNDQKITNINCDSTPPSKTVFLRELILLDWIVAGQHVAELKDNGCNTNVLSTELVERNQDFLDIHQERSVSHSDHNRTKTSAGNFSSTTVELGLHKYTSTWLVAKSRYGVLPGMPWHADTNPSINYNTHSVTVNDTVLSTRHLSQPKPSVETIGVKNFRSLLQKKKWRSGDFTIFQVSNIESRQPLH